MAHIVFFMLWEPGHLLPTFRIGRDLTERGHRVTYLTTADLLEGPRSRGFDTVSILAKAFPPGSQGRTESSRSRRRCLAALEEAARTGEVVRQIQSLLPDLVLIDVIFVPTYVAYLQTHRVPLLVVNTSLPNEGGEGLPPTTVHTVPDGSLASRLANELAWKRFQAVLWRAYVFRGQPMVRPRLRLELPELVLCSEEFDFPRPPRKGRHYVGPSVELERPRQEFPWHALKDKGSLIYCSFGTQAHRYSRVMELIASLVRAVAQNPVEQLVIAAQAAVIDDLTRQGLPNNVIAVERAPQIELLRRASVAITHGGLGTVKECVLLGVPMIVFPQSFDQPGNAARVHFHGIGVRTRRPIRHEEARDLLDTISRSTTIAANIRRMQQAFQRAQSSAPAARIIESYL
jgi:MGT family glycosyltransferase